MNTKGVILFGFLAALAFSSKASESKIQYTYMLGEKNSAISGRVSVAAEKGDKVLAITDKPSENGHNAEGEGAESFLQIVVKHNEHLKIKSPAPSFDITMPTNPPMTARQTQDDQTASIAEKLTTEDSKTTANAASFTETTVHQQSHGHNIAITHTLHTGSPPHSAVVKRSLQTSGANTDITGNDAAMFQLQDTETFFIDPVDYYVKVNDTSYLLDHEYVKFYILLVNTNGEAVSNPLPFIIYVDRPEISSSVPVVPAAFAGVLVLCVIFLAILIPVVTRAKRRFKQGKPLFKLGSHPSSADLEKSYLENASSENSSSIPRNSSEPNWYGNNVYYNYEEEIQNEQKDFAQGIKKLSVKRPVPSSHQPTTRTESSTLQLTKKIKEPVSSSSSSSGVDVHSTETGTIAEETINERL